LYKGDDETANEGGNYLSYEHNARGNLHVVTKLEVGGETDRLVSSDEGRGLEDHIRNGSSGEHVTTNQLVHNLWRNLLVGDGLEHA
jgi:hypothetical protein